MSKFEEKILGMKSSTKFFGLLVLLVWGVMEVKAQTLSLPYEQTFNSHPQWQSDFLKVQNWNINSTSSPGFIYSTSTSNDITTHFISIEPNSIVTVNWAYQNITSNNITTFFSYRFNGTDWIDQHFVHTNTGTEWRTQSTEFSVGNNSQIQLRWTVDKTFYRFDNLDISAVVIKKYYNQQNSDLSEPSNWNSLPDGTGDALSTFNNTGIELYIVNGTENFSNEWNIPISNNRVIIDEEAKLTILGNYTGPDLEVNNGILQINTANPPPIGILSENSYVIYGGNDQIIGDYQYFNLDISGTGLTTVEATYLFCNTLYLNSSTLEMPPLLYVENNLMITSGKLKGDSESSLYIYGSNLDLDFSTNDQFLNYLFAENAEINIKSNLNIDEADFGTSNIIISENMTLSLDNDVVLSLDNQIETIGNLEILGNLYIISPEGLSSNISDINNLIVGENSTITFNAADGSQNITELPAPGYANLALAGNSTKEAGSSNIIIRGTFTRSGGSLNIGSSTFTFSGGTRTLPDMTFHNLTMTNGAIANSGSNLNVTGNLTLSSGGTLNGGESAINVEGNWENNEGTFNAGTSNVSFNGTSAQAVNGNTTFNNVVFSSSGLKTLSDNHSFAQITIDNGATVDAGSSTLTLAGNFTNNGTFNPETSTLIFSGNSTLTSASHEFDFNHITISGTVTPTPVLNISGDWTYNSGVFQVGSGTINFHGSTQNIYGENTFYNLTASSSELILNDKVNLLNNLKLDAGVLNSNNHLVLVSNVERDARILPVLNGGSIIGNINVQRYVPGNGIGYKVYRYVSSPVHGATVAQIQQSGVAVTGKFSGSNDQNWGSSLFYYANKWMPYPTASNTEILINGRGYALYVMGANKQAITATLNFIGQPQIGDVNVNMVSGWNLIGNPYAAPIDWGSIYEEGNVNSEIAIKDNTGREVSPGGFAYFAGDLGTGDFNGIIASGQSFWVEALNNHTMTITESDKAQEGETGTFLRKKTPTDYLRILMINNEYKDEAIIRFSKDAVEEYDSKYDASKKDNDFFDISSLTENGLDLAINTLPFASSRTVALRIKDTHPGTYTISFKDYQSLLNHYEIFLVDNFTGEKINLTEQNEYSFTVTNDESSFGDNRMRLTFNQNSNPVLISIGGKGTQQNSVVSVPVQVSEFENIGSFQFSLGWDPQLLEYLSTTNFFNQTLNENNFNYSQTEKGVIAVSWDETTGKSISLKDLTTLFDLNFKVIGQPGQFATIEFINDPLPVEIGNSESIVLQADTTNGAVNILKSLQISGILYNRKGSIIENALVRLEDESVSTTTSNASGTFIFDAIEGRNYNLSIEKTDNPTATGISTLDIAMARRHLLQKQVLTDPYQIIAADVDLNDGISILDIALMRKVVLRVSDHFPSQKSWTFIPANHIFSDPGNPFDFPKISKIYELNENKKIDFIGIKLGDVNLSWEDNSRINESDDNLYFDIEPMITMENDKISVPIKVRSFKNIAGFQFTIQWDPNKYSLDDIPINTYDCHFGLTYLSDGFLTVLWNENNGEQLTLTDDEVFLGINFKTIDKSTNSHSIEINGELTPLFAFNGNLESVKVISNNVVNSDYGFGFTGIKNYPNPFSEETTFVFDLPTKSPVKIIIYDGVGRLVDEINGEYQKGSVQINWSNKYMEAKPGQFLYYQAITNFGQLNGKMMLK